GFSTGKLRSYQNQNRLRKAADPRAGAFLRKLTGVQASRVLISTRLFPADLETQAGKAIPGSTIIELNGLGDDDAVQLWRSLGVTGSQEALTELFHAFDNYPLLIRALAGEVARYRRAPGDFDAWREANTDFDPFQMPMMQRQSHVLEFALSGLEAREIQVLRTIAAFNSPASYNALADLLISSSGKVDTKASKVQQAAPVLQNDDGELSKMGAHRNVPLQTANNTSSDTIAGAHGRAPLQDAINPEIIPESESLEKEKEGKIPTRPLPPFHSENELDEALTELEDRGLLGWDRAANRYDLHPVVRGVVWTHLDRDNRRDIYERMRSHFAAMPITEDWREIHNPDDLTASIELYHTLIGLGRYDEACDLLANRLYRPLRYRFSDGQQLAELLELLFPDEHPLPRLSEARHQSWVLHALAMAYQMTGKPGLAVPLFERSNTLKEEASYTIDLSTGLRDLAYAQRLVGRLRYSEVAARRALLIDRKDSNRLLEAISLQVLGLALAARGAFDESQKALDR
ncbi:MAG TPA: hypothetical protein VJZ27_16980, partial [Aggregatilineales bacterium]|nr:hypothetical protein [Aggregatilineales bacterium]